MTVKQTGKRVILTLILEAIFVAFLIGGSAYSDDLKQDKNQVAFSVKESSRIAFRNDGGREAAGQINFKSVQLASPESSHPPVVQLSSWLLDSPQCTFFSRYFVHIFYVFISSKAP